ncbi:DUF4231 domain-containing protein [Nocardia niigatensis]
MLNTEDLPGLFQAADEAAISGQRSHLQAFALRLWLAIIAAACAAVTLHLGTNKTDVTAIGTALAFVGILTVDVGVLRTRPSRTWHEGRALAESVKTLAWKYAVCGAPFDHTHHEPDADALLIERIRVLHSHIADITLHPTTGTTITDRMRTLRRAQFTERRKEYISHRIQDQQHWYAKKSRQHHHRGVRLEMIALILEVVGVSAALAKAFNVIDFDLAGIVAAAIAGVAAWSSARQYNRLAAAYAVTSSELAMTADILRNTDESHWAAAVSDAEETVNREHILWRASHTE